MFTTAVGTRKQSMTSRLARLAAGRQSASPS